VRVTICNFENLVASAVRRALRLNETDVSPRVSDLAAVLASTTGKIELETVGDSREDRIVEKLIQGAVINVFNRYFSVQEFDDLVQAFENGLNLEVGDTMPSMEYMMQASSAVGLKAAMGRLDTPNNPASIASAVEFVLEGLHLNRKLNKDRMDHRSRYRR
jgi:magnesium chelatase subunit I